MSAAFTQGPWKVRYTKFSEVITPQGALVATCKNLIGLANLQANARLIASAPDLHAIVSRLASLVDGLNNGNSAAEIEACRLAEQARALLSTVTTTKDAEVSNG